MVCIRSILPLEDYRLQIEFHTGSSVIVNLSSKLKTARFAELSDKTVFNNVKNDSDTIIWGDGVLKISVYELIDVAVTGI